LGSLQRCIGEASLLQGRRIPESIDAVLQLPPDKMDKMLRIEVEFPARPFC
jgi:hypothetical protein